MLKTEVRTLTLSQLCIRLRKTQRFTDYSISNKRKHCSLDAQQQTAHQINSSMPVNTSQKLPKLYMLQNFSIQIYLHLKDEPHFFLVCLSKVFLLHRECSLCLIKLSLIERQVSIENWVFTSIEESSPKNTQNVNIPIHNRNQSSERFQQWVELLWSLWILR